LKLASRFCRQVSVSSRTEHLHIQRSWLKTGLPSTAVTSSEKTTPNSPDLNPLDYHVWELCLNATRHFNPSQIPLKEEESLANNMASSTTELHQQGRTELYKKTSSLCESWGGHFEHVFK